MSGLTLILDRTRPHGTCHGEGLTHGLSYEQDGLPFDHEGNLIMALVTSEAQKQLVDKKLARMAKRLARDEAAQATTQGEGAGAAPAASVPATQADDDDDEDENFDDDVNFDAWARGMEQVPWVVLQKAARKRFAKVFRSKEQIIEFLVFDAKMLGLDDVVASMRPAAQAE
jgi:hypothetical protein